MAFGHGARRKQEKEREALRAFEKALAGGRNAGFNAHIRRQNKEALASFGGQEGLDQISAARDANTAAQNSVNEGRGKLAVGTIGGTGKGDGAKVIVGNRAATPHFRSAVDASSEAIDRGDIGISTRGTFAFKRTKDSAPGLTKALQALQSDRSRINTSAQANIRKADERQAETVSQTAAVRPSSFQLEALNGAVLNKTKKRKFSDGGLPRIAGLLEGNGSRRIT